MQRTLKSLLPSILLGLGIIASTALAAALSGWAILAGPCLMALVILVAFFLGQRVLGVLRGTLTVALIHAAALLLASLIVALRDPELVVSMLPILGGAAVVPMSRSTCSPCRILGNT